VEVANPAVSAEALMASPKDCDKQDRLRRVFRHCGDGLYRFILVRVGGDRNVADDLLQQTCHEAARHRRMPDDDTECEAWLHGIARNLIRRHWRQNGRSGNHVTVEDARLSQQLVEDMESHPLPPDAVARKELGHQLLLAVTALPASDQHLVFAFYFEGRSQAEIASELGVTVKSIETRLYRTRQRLRTILRDGERT
jgi:RNA polymerase sigma-70 factor (ECF subfamily)